MLERMTVSLSPNFTHLLSPRASNESADIGSPCEPVARINTSAGSRSDTSSMSMMALRGTFMRPRSRARRTFFCMERPRVATTRPLSTAASINCCARWIWLAKLAVMMRRPRCSAMTCRNTDPTSRSLGACPRSSAFVLSANSKRTPLFDAMAPRRAKSVRRSSTGVRSILKSPECTTTPWAVCNTIA